MPASYLVRYFSTEFLPLGASIYEEQAPNAEAIAAALDTLKVTH